MPVKTHGSAVNHQTTDYDRLEFLGDGILDFSMSLRVSTKGSSTNSPPEVVWHNFQTYPNLSPGGLSLLKVRLAPSAAPRPC